jgi:hypothetical protein
MPKNFLIVKIDGAHERHRGPRSAIRKRNKSPVASIYRLFGGNSLAF